MKNVFLSLAVVGLILTGAAACNSTRNATDDTDSLRMDSIRMRDSIMRDSMMRDSNNRKSPDTMQRG